MIEAASDRTFPSDGVEKGELLQLTGLIAGGS
jgi:hypothetical protein